MARRQLQSCCFRVGAVLLLLCVAVGAVQGIALQATPATIGNQAALEITETRLRIYQTTIQALALETARGLGNGIVTPLPTLPFGVGNTTHEVVVLDKFTVENQGYKFHEFYIPPGTQFDTQDGQIVLIYQRYENVNSPVTPPSGYNLEAPIISLSAFAISALNNPGAPQVLVTAPANQHISVVFPTTTAGPSSFCTTFNLSGSIVIVPSTVRPASITCLPQSIGTFTVLKQNPISPAPAPAPAPGAPAPSPSEGTFPLPGVQPPPAAEAPSPSSSGGSGGGSSSGSNSVALGVGLGVGLGVPLLLLAAFGVWYAMRGAQKRKLENMEKESDQRASLETAIVGGSRAPAAGALRTKPFLETEDLATDRI